MICINCLCCKNTVNFHHDYMYDNHQLNVNIPYTVYTYNAKLCKA